MKEEVSCNNMGCHTRQCPRTVLNKYVKHFRGALSSIHRTSSQLGLPHSTVHDIFDKGLKLNAYRLQLVQKITCRDCNSEKQFTLEWLSCSEEDDTYLYRVCFSDEGTCVERSAVTVVMYEEVKILMMVLHMNVIH
jgi:hypothetical protein